MVEFINSLTGTRMFVADGRAGEYRRAGHRPVNPTAPAESDADAGRETGAKAEATAAPSAAAGTAQKRPAKAAAKTSAAAKRKNGCAKMR